MRYVLMVRAKPETSSVQDKHADFISRVSRDAIDIFSAVPNSPKEPTTDPVVEVKLKSFLKPPFRGILRYQNRAYVREEASFDDYVMIEFDPRKTDLAALACITFPAFVDAFGAYFGYIADEEFVHHDFDAHRDVDIRRSVPRVFPVMFIDRRLCSDSFDSLPAKLVARLGAEVSREFAGGLLVTALTRPVPFLEACAFSDSLTATAADRLS